MLQTLGRLWRHTTITHRAVQKMLGSDGAERIAAAIARAEGLHRGQIVVLIEHALEPAAVLRHLTPRERAIELFAHHRVWDTGENNGVLLYFLLAERDVEIVADRGFTNMVPEERWQSICRIVEQQCAEGRYLEGVVSGIEAIGDVLVESFPRRKGDVQVDELPNEPILE